MTDNTAPRLESACPIFHTADVEKALAWYRDSLGFKVAFQWPEPDSGQPPHYGGVQSGNITIHFSTNGGTIESKVYIIVSGDIDALATQIKALGTKLESEPKTEPYGMREFAVKDPDGHQLFLAKSATKERGAE